ncbi:hypothetical protein [Saccharospirillum impatiens]|nr:hypothetical protein [Saccharospirillum impatiens]
MSVIGRIVNGNVFVVRSARQTKLGWFGLRWHYWYTLRLLAGFIKGA